MAIPYTTIATENLGDDQIRKIRGYDLPGVGVALNVLVELTIRAPYRPTAVQRIVDEEVVIPGVTVAQLSGLSFTTQDTVDLGDGQKRYIRHFTIPGRGTVVSVVATTDYKFGTQQRTIVVSEEVYFRGAYAAGAESFVWNNLTTVLPTGISGSALTGLYQFDGSGSSLTDRSGNGRNLSVSGTESYCGIPTSSGSGTLVAMAFPEDKHLYLTNSAHNADFRFLGAMVIELLTVFEGNTGNADTFVDFGPAVHGDPDSDKNIAYVFQAYQDNGRFYYFHETGGGVNQGGAYSSYCYPGLIQHLILNRSAGGLVQIIQNGIKVVEASLTNPTDASSGYLRIGRRTHGNIETLNGAIASMRFLGGVSYSQAQWEESYQRVRGIIL